MAEDIKKSALREGWTKRVEYLAEDIKKREGWTKSAEYLA